MSQWYCRLNGHAEVGPLSGGQVKRLAQLGKLRPTDPVRRSDMNTWVAARSIQGLFALPPVPDPVATTPWEQLNEGQEWADQSVAGPGGGSPSANRVTPGNEKKLPPRMSRTVVIGLVLLVAIVWFSGLAGQIGEGLRESWNRPNTVRGVRAAIYSLRLENAGGPNVFFLRRAELFKAVGKPSTRSVVGTTTVWTWNCVDGVVQVVAIEDDLTFVKEVNEFSR